MTKRNIIAIGKTGFGKSFILSRLLGQTDDDTKPIFVSKNETDSCTDKIDKESRQVNTLNGELFELTAYDTPGIADSKGRTRQFLDEIMTTIKTTELHKILIFTKYGRFDSNLQNNFNVLNMCLNGLNTSNCILVINEIPKEKKFKKENPDGNLQSEIGELQVKISQALHTTFAFTFAIESTDEPDESVMFKNQINAMRTVIFHTTQPFINKQCKTWSEIITVYTNDISRIRNSENERKNALKLELDNMRDSKTKFEVDIVSHEGEIERERSKGKSLFSQVMQWAGPALTVVSPLHGVPLWAGSAFNDYRDFKSTGNRIHDLEKMIEIKRKMIEELKGKIGNCENMDRDQGQKFLEDLTKKENEVERLKTLVS